MALITGLNWTVDQSPRRPFQESHCSSQLRGAAGERISNETKSVLSSNSTGAFATVPEIPPRSRILSDCATLGNFERNFILSPIMISITPRGYSYYKKSPSADYPAQNSGVGICKRYRNRNFIRIVCVCKISDYNVCTVFPTIYNSPRRLT